MSWHEPGRDRDPWRNPEEGPPDLDEWFRRVRQRLHGWFSRSPRPPGARHLSWWWFIPIILIGIWLLTGFYRVPAKHQALALRFGAYIRTVDPGLHWHWPWPIASDRLVDVSEGRSLSQRAQVLTRDGKLLELGLTVSYRISNPYQYAFGSRQPDRLITALANEALADVARSSDFATLRSNDTTALDKPLKARISRALAVAGAGVTVQSVGIDSAELPDAVKQSQARLADVLGDNAKQQKKAQQAAKKSFRAAQEKAGRIIADAKREAETREAIARGRAAHFEALLPAWEKSPEVARETLRASILANVLGAIPKVVVSGSVHSVTLPPLPASAAATASKPTSAAPARSS
ncbi:MAG: protease modulator HflK, partial [Gammaproteobacteria bacterium]